MASLPEDCLFCRISRDGPHVAATRRLRRGPRHPSAGPRARARHPEAARRRVCARSTASAPRRTAGCSTSSSGQPRASDSSDFRVVANVGAGAGQSDLPPPLASARRPRRAARELAVSDEPDLIERIELEVKSAMLARDAERRDALRLILASLRRPRRSCSDRSRPTRSCRCSSASASDGSRRPRRSATRRPRGAGRAGGRELAVLEEFMPTPLSEEELDAHRRRRDRRDRRHEHPRHGPGDGRRDAPDRRTRRRQRREPAGAREARLSPPPPRRAPRRAPLRGAPRRPRSRRRREHGGRSRRPATAPLATRARRDRARRARRRARRQRLKLAPTLAPVQEMLDVSNAVAAELAGMGDRMLETLRERLDCTIRLRGNQLTLEGEDSQVEEARDVIDGLVELVEGGHTARRPNRRRGARRTRQRAHACATCSTTSSGGTAASRSRPRRSPRRPTSTRSVAAPSPSGSARPAPARPTWRWRSPSRRCRRARSTRIILTRPAVEAGERLGFLPGDMLAKVDPYLRPLFDALYDMLDPERANTYMERGTIEVAPARLHARAHAERQLHHPRRGAEHLARADADVPDPARLRLADRRHRRHHPDRPAARPGLRSDPGAGRSSTASRASPSSSSATRTSCATSSCSGSSRPTASTPRRPAPNGAVSGC